MVTVTESQHERLGLLARLKPMSLMNGTSPRVVGPISTGYDHLFWVVSIAQNQGCVSIEIQHSVDGTHWESYDPPLTHSSTNDGDTIRIAMNRAEDVTPTMRWLRMIVTGTFDQAWHYAGIEVTVRYVF